MQHFSGSYAPDDVQFLLKPMHIHDTPVHEKELLIQSGQKHYSELLSQESLPPPAYVELFYRGMALNQQRLATHLLALASKIHDTRPTNITLVSLARAGTPIGVVLKRLLARYFHRSVQHYSISILRDKGLDLNALRFILQKHSPESLVFVDGWTGKGVMARQLAKSLQEFASSDGISIPPELYVVADLSGTATVAATAEDYLIPSCILNATVSGLVSRSVYSQKAKHPDDFHGCVFYEQFQKDDLSQYFVETLLNEAEQIWPYFASLPQIQLNCEHLQMVSTQFLAWLQNHYVIAHVNHIKPGIGEASRVLLRREARMLLLQDMQSEATQHLRWLADAKAIPVAHLPDSPYKAVALIKELAL